MSVFQGSVNSNLLCFVVYSPKTGNLYYFEDTLPSEINVNLGALLSKMREASSASEKDSLSLATSWEGYFQKSAIVSITPEPDWTLDLPGQYFLKSYLQYVTINNKNDDSIDYGLIRAFASDNRYVVFYNDIEDNQYAQLRTGFYLLDTTSGEMKGPFSTRIDLNEECKKENITDLSLWQATPYEASGKPMSYTELEENAVTIGKTIWDVSLPNGYHLVSRNGYIILYDGELNSNNEVAYGVRAYVYGDRFIAFVKEDVAIPDGLSACYYLLDTETKALYGPFETYDDFMVSYTANNAVVDGNWKIPSVEAAQ